MANQEFSQVTDGGVPLSADVAVGYRTAGVAGGNRRWSFANIATFIRNVFATGAALASLPYAANSGTAYTIDPANGGQLDLTLNGVTPVITLQAVVTGQAVRLPITLIQDGTGSRVPSFVNVTWAAGVTPTIASAISARTYLEFISDGVTWTGYALNSSTGTGAQVLANSPILVTPVLGAATATTINGVTIPTTTDTVALLGTPQGFTAQQNFVAVSTASASNLTAWNLNTAQGAYQSMLENTTLSNPTNQVNNGTYIFQFIQNASSAKTLAFGTNYIWDASGAPTISATLSSVLICTFVSDGTKMRGGYKQYTA